MALSGYMDVYTAENYAERVQDIKTELTSLITSNYFDSLKAQVQTEIEILKQKEQTIYELLHLKDKSIEGLNRRMQNYQNAVLNLSGPRLNQEIVYILKNKDEEDFQFYTEKVNEIIENEIINKIGQTGSKGQTLNTFSEAVVDFLNSQLKGHGFSSKHGMNDIARELIFADITPQQRNGWKKIIDRRLREEQTSIEAQNNPDSVTVQFNWREITDNLTSKQAEELDKKNPQRIDEINNDIITQIMLMAPKDANLLKDIIQQKILLQNRYAFFVGKNVNEIIGICGEIQGLYYIAKMLGIPEENSFSAFEWIGGTIDTNKGQKPHRDILLGEFGIQVKNSLKRDFHEVRFGKASIDTVIKKIGLSNDAEDLLKNYYGSLSFNVPYNIEATHYIEVSTPEEALDCPNKPIYQAAYKELHSLNNDIDKLLSLCASALMYMSVENNSKDVDANTLYLLSGAAFVAASDILQRVLNEIDANERSMKTIFSYNDFSNRKTIVDAFNSNVRSGDYSSSVIQNIILTSSFDFSYLNDLYKVI